MIKSKSKTFIDRNQRILSLIKQGVPFYEIAAQFDMSISELSDFADAETENEKLRHTLELKNAIIQLHEQGKNHNEIADIKNTNSSVVNKILSDHFQYKTLTKPNILPVANDKFTEQDPDKFFELTGPERIKRNRDVIAAYQSGLAIAEVMQKYGLTHSTTYAILKSHKIPLRKKTGVSASLLKRNNEIITAYKNGLTVKEVAEQFEIAPSTVYQAIRNNNVLLKKHERFSKVKELFNQGMTCREIAQIINTRASSIRNLLRQKGLIELQRVKRIKQAAQVETLFNEGLTREEICQRVNTSISFVYKVLKNRGHYSRDQKRDKIIQYLQSGNSIDQAAHQFSLSSQYVRQIARKAGIALENYREAKKKTIATLFKQNVKISEIAHTLSMNPASVIQNLIAQKLLAFKGCHRLKKQLLLEEFQNGNTNITKLALMYNIRPDEAQSLCSGNSRPQAETKVKPTNKSAVS